MRLSPAVKKLIPVTAGLVIIIAVSAVALVYLSREGISVGERCAGRDCWGYKLEQYDFLNKARLRFWGTWGLDVSYNLPPMNIEKVTEDHWLGDRAVYLNLMFRPKNDSAALGNRVRILYDFQRGELYVSSPLQLWRAPDETSNDPGRNWMTDTQFDEQLEALTPE